MEYGLTYLAIEAHPDDVALSAGGTLIKGAERGYQTGILTLTDGTLASRGDPQTRLAECEAARKALNLSYWESLNFPDGEITDGSNANDRSRAQAIALARKFCEHRPEIVLAPHWIEMHRDHVAASRLVREALQLAGLKMWVKKHIGLKPYQPRQLLYYPFRISVPVNIVTDVSKVYDRKLNAIECYASQVGAEQGLGAQVRMASPLNREWLRARDVQYGAQIGVQFGEGFVTTNMTSIDDFAAHARTHDTRGALAFPEAR